MTFRQLKWTAFGLALVSVVLFAVDLTIHSPIDAATAVLLFITNVLAFFSNYTMEKR